jgi:flagellar protein FlbD
MNLTPRTRRILLVSDHLPFSPVGTRLALRTTHGLLYEELRRKSHLSRRAAEHLAFVSPVAAGPPPMIHVTRLNHVSVVLNSDLIESIEVTPDTVISMTTGQKLMVLESAEEIVARVVEYRRLIHTPRSEPSTDPRRTQTAIPPTEIDTHGTV